MRDAKRSAAPLSVRRAGPSPSQRFHPVAPDPDAHVHAWFNTWLDRMERWFADRREGCAAASIETVRQLNDDIRARTGMNSSRVANGACALAARARTALLQGTGQVVVSEDFAASNSA